MSKTAIDILNTLISPVTENHTYKIHTIFNATVPTNWQIEANRKNDDLHMLLVHSGEGKYIIDGTEYPLTHGTVLFVSNGCPHHSYANPNNPPHITPIRFGVYSDNNVMQPLFSSPNYFVCHPKRFPDFQIKFQQLHACHHNSLLNYAPTLCHSLLTQILIDLLYVIEETTKPIDVRISSAKKYIEENPTQRISLDALASSFHLSARQFSRLFKGAYGQPPKHFMLEVQMNYAHFLIAYTNTSITDVAKLLNYPDPYSFSKQFKRIMHYNPSEIK